LIRKRRLMGLQPSEVDDNNQAIEEPDEVTNLTSGSEAERRGRPRRLG